MLKALFVGLGSIGQRHLRNFQSLLGDEAECLVYRRTNHALVIQNGEATACKSLSEHYGVTSVNSLAEALALKPDIVFVTNPSSYHLDVAMQAACAGCHVFIEKPLSHDVEGVENLVREVRSRGVVATVGYQSRFDPCYQVLVQSVNDARYGAMVSASFEWGTYMPSHHPYEDYRQGYAALSSLGGGVLLGLSHEVDIIYSLCGQPQTVHALGGQLSNLEMNADDTVAALLGYGLNGKTVPVQLFLSYAQTHETRRVRVQFERATLLADLVSKNVQVVDDAGKVVVQEDYSRIERNQLFLDEMSDFLKAVSGDKEVAVSVEDGLEVLKLVTRIKEAMHG